MKPASRFVVAVAVLLSVALGASGQTTAPATQPTTRPGKVVKLLTVGNSFAGNSTKYLGALAAAAGDKLVLGSANPGGCSLERHWKAAAAFDANPEDPAGLLYALGSKDKPKMTSLKQMLDSQSWDYVTIQQASPLSDKPESYQPFADNLAAYIRQHEPAASILIHQTWAYRADHAKFKTGGGPAEMHEKVRANYHALAERLKLEILPVGDAMFAAMNDPAFQYQPDPDFDPATATPPQLPQEKGGVHLSFRWQKNSKTGKDELVRDAFHANARGCYLGAAVFFEELFGKSVVGNSYVPKELTADEVSRLQKIAHDTVSKLRVSAAR